MGGTVQLLIPPLRPSILQGFASVGHFGSRWLNLYKRGGCRGSGARQSLMEHALDLWTPPSFVEVDGYATLGGTVGLIVLACALVGTHVCAFGFGWRCRSRCSGRMPRSPPTTSDTSQPQFSFELPSGHRVRLNNVGRPHSRRASWLAADR